MRSAVVKAPSRMTKPFRGRLAQVRSTLGEEIDRLAHVAANGGGGDAKPCCDLGGNLGHDDTASVCPGAAGGLRPGTSWLRDQAREGARRESSSRAAHASQPTEPGEGRSGLRSAEVRMLAGMTETE